MEGKLTRREWAGVLGASAAAARAQGPADGGVMEEARAELRETIERLQKFRLPAATEPAVVFRP
jgi:hypothetical protein